MIKADIHKVKDGEKKGTTSCQIEICGDVKEVISEVCMFVENIRKSLDKVDKPAIRLAFSGAVMAAALGKPFPFGDDDDEEDDDK